MAVPSKYQPTWVNLLTALTNLWSTNDRPTLLLPGIMGSELCDGRGSTLWAAVYTLVDGLNSLRFQGFENSGGINLHNNLIKPTRELTLPSILPGPPDVAYTELRKQRTTVLYPYDWRDSLDVEAGHLLAFLELARARGLVGPHRRINIVTHSMGSLLLMAALGKSGGAIDDILHTVTFVAPPFRGAVDIIDILATGNSVLGHRLLDRWINYTTFLLRCARTFPGVFQLLLHDRAAFNNIAGIPAQEYPVVGMDDPLTSLLLRDWSTLDITVRQEALRQAQVCVCCERNVHVFLFV